MTDHIANIVGRYKGQCYAWDVVNEVLNEDGSYRQYNLYNIIGPDYIPIAFAAAAQADPDAKLYYNDYNIEYSGAKASGAVKLVKAIQSYGAPIHGVGLESHFISGQTPTTSNLESTMQSYIDLDVDVAITELDVRMQLQENSQKDQQQATDYVTVVKACLDTDRCVGVTVCAHSPLRISTSCRTFESRTVITDSATGLGL
jgi:endo-1,4-beta-xylanase